MRLPFFLPAISLVVLLAFAIAGLTASAQDIFITPVPNAPFIGVVNVERSHVQPNGSVITFKTTREIGRDSRGRIHNESRLLVSTSDSKTPLLLRVHLYDPQTRISTYLDPLKKTFWSETVDHPPSTVPPTVRFASPAVNGLPQNEFTREEDLGIREMDGVRVRGVREIQTIPAEDSGTGKEIVISDEYWYSEDLRINLMVRHSDPRKESVIMTVDEVTLSDPDPAFFEIPEGYKRASAAGKHQ